MSEIDQNIDDQKSNDNLSEKVQKLLKKSEKNEISAEEKRWIKNTLNLLEISEKLHTAPKKKITWSVYIFLLCIVLVSLSMWLRVGDIGFIKSLSSNNFSLTIQTNGIYLTLDKNGDYNLLNNNYEISVTDFHVSQISEIHISNAGKSLKDSFNSLELRTEGKLITLNEIKSERDAHIHISNFNNSTYFSILNSKISGSLVAYSGIINVPGYFTIQVNDTLDPEFIDYRLSSPDSVFPSTIYIETNDDLSLLEGKKIKDIRFLNEFVENMDELKLESSIISGKLQLPSINKEVELSSMEILRLEEPEAYITGFTITEDSMEIILMGRAKKIECGYFETIRNQCPTLLGYFYNNQPLILFWSTLVFLLGLIKSVRDRFI